MDASGSSVSSGAPIGLDNGSPDGGFPPNVMEQGTAHGKRDRPHWESEPNPKAQRFSAVKVEQEADAAIGEAPQPPPAQIPEPPQPSLTGVPSHGEQGTHPQGPDAGNAEQGDRMQGGSQAPVPVTTPSANEPLSTMQRALEPQGLPGYVPGQRAFYSDGFKEMVVREAMLCPEGARIKPTCARFPGVEPVQVRTSTNHKPSAPAAPEPRDLPFPCALSLLNLFPSLLPMCCAASQVDAQDLRTWHGASRRRGNRGSFVAGPGRPSR